LLTYKATLVGMRVAVTEESDTSTCSFLDLEPVAKQEVYARRSTLGSVSSAASCRRALGAV
jgi:hypothetical protein